MLLKQYMIILITVMSLVGLSCVDVPSTAPVIPEKLKTSTKIDQVLDVKTLEENTEARSNERKDVILDQDKVVEVKIARDSSE